MVFFLISFNGCDFFLYLQLRRFLQDFFILKNWKCWFFSLSLFSVWFNCYFGILKSWNGMKWLLKFFVWIFLSFGAFEEWQSRGIFKVGWENGMKNEFGEILSWILSWSFAFDCFEKFKICENWRGNVYSFFRILSQ